MNLNENYTIKRVDISNCEGLENLIEDSEKRQHFISYYLGDTTNFRAYGYFVNDQLHGVISCIKSLFDASWYITHVFYLDISIVPKLLSYCITTYENEGLYKFYNLVSENDNNDLFWKDTDKERYIHVDECVIPVKTKCFYNHYWLILQERLLLDTEYIVRCNFLKQEYRKSIPISGNI